MIITEYEPQKNHEAGVGEVVESWSRKMRLSEETLLDQFDKGLGVFSREKIAGQNPETDIEFWVSNGILPVVKLDGSVKGQKGAYSTRELLMVSSDLAGEAAKKISEGKNFDELTKAEKVSMLALTKAKIKAVEPLALDVYPGLKNEFDEAKSAVDEQLTGLLVDRAEVTDIEGKVDWARVIPAGKMALPTMAVLSAIALAACTPGNGVTETPIVVSPSEVPTLVTPEQVPSEVPTTIPTETSVPTEVGTGEILWPAQGNETISKVDNLDLGMEFKDPKKAYREMLGALIANKEFNGKFFQALLGTETPTVDQFLAFLRESVGPDGRPYYMPFTVNGIEYKWLSGDPTGPAAVRYAPVSKLREGVYLEDFTVMMFTLEEYRANKESIDKLFEYNRKGGIMPIFPDGMFALMITPDGRSVFVQGNLKSLPEGWPSWSYEVPFGGADGIIDQTDIQKYTAGWMIYLRAANNFTKDSHGQPFYCYTRKCSVLSGGLPYDDVTPEEEVVEFE